MMDFNFNVKRSQDTRILQAMKAYVLYTHTFSYELIILVNKNYYNILYILRYLE